MIGSTFSSQPYGVALRQSLESGTLTSAKIQVANATPQIQAQLDATFAESERSLVNMTAYHRANPSWASFDTANNSVALPDVEGLNKSDAAHVLKGLQYLMAIGRLDGQSVSAKNGSQATDSVAAYQDWLQARIGVDVHA